MAFVAAIIVFASCSKSSDSPSNDSGSYPKNVTLEYRVTKLSGDKLTSGSSIVIYPGGQDSPDNLALPISLKYDVKDVKQFDGFSASFTGLATGSVRLDLLVDGKVVKSSTASGTNMVYGTVTYLFP